MAEFVGTPRPSLRFLLCVVALMAMYSCGRSPLESVPPAADGDSLMGKLIVGYQGWFSCSPIDANWQHWFRGNRIASENLSVDFWPDTSEMGADELCPTGWKDATGNPVFLFSSSHPKTVARHFRWMRDYGIDGAAAQRFVSEISNPSGRARTDRVLTQLVRAAEQTRRVFFVYYDISGAHEKRWKEELLADWQRLNRDLRVATSSAYLRHRGRPLVGVWGLGFTDRPGNPPQAAALIAALKAGGGGAPPATVLGGVPSQWRTLSGDSKADSDWRQVYRSFDVLSPWTVGRYRDQVDADRFFSTIVAADMRETDLRGIDYLPVIFPGFSDANLTGGRRSGNLIPRACGAFYRHQIDGLLKLGARAFYTAMFDEVDEGTAVFKTTPNRERLPVAARLQSLDVDGCSLPSDWYLKLTGAAGRALSK